MKVLQLSLVVLMCSMAAGLIAYDNSSRAIGLQFGTSSGSGYSYRWIGEDHGLQFTLGAITYGSNDVKFPNYLYDEDVESPGAETTLYHRKGRKSAMSVGLNYINILDSSRSSRFYLAIGGAYTIKRDKDIVRSYNRINNNYYEYQLDTTVPAVKTTLNRDKWTVGGGPGFELTLDKHFRFTFDLPFTYNSDEEMIMYIPQVGLYYYFK